MSLSFRVVVNVCDEQRDQSRADGSGLARGEGPHRRSPSWLRTVMITGATLASCPNAGTGEIAGIKRSLMPGAPVMTRATRP